MIAFTIPIKTRNPNNGATGNTRVAGIMRARVRATQRKTAWAATLNAVGLQPRFPCSVLLVRVAPSNGLDPHDGLGASLKGIIDGVADGLGLKNDRDARVTWVLAQRRGAAGVYAVEIEIRPREDVGDVEAPHGATSRNW